MAAKYSVLMVCMGNICRSPTAEGVLCHLVREAGLQEAIQIDSAGTLGYHAGSPPDERSRRHALRRGYDLSALRARQVQVRDFGQQVCPPEHQHKLRRLMEFAPAGLGDVVADPYYGDQRGFEAVLDHVELACAGLLRHLRGQVAQR
jgi:protein-tyrosine phosphatase